MSSQPILGSIQWMNQSGKTVVPVYDGNNITVPIYLISESGQYLKSESGAFLIAGTTTVPANLVRWI